MKLSIVSSGPCSEGIQKYSRQRHLVVKSYNEIFKNPNNFQINNLIKKTQQNNFCHYHLTLTPP